MKQEIERDEFLRKRAARQRKKKKRKLIFFFSFLIVLLLCVGVTLCLTIFFPIEKIKISGSEMYSYEQIEKASGIKLGDNLFITSKADTELKLKQKLPYVEKIEFKKQLPETLIIKVYDAYEFCCYAVNGRYYLVSENGWVLEKKNEIPENIFTVYGAKTKCKVGSEIIFEDTSQKELVDLISKSCVAGEIKPNSIDLSKNATVSLVVNSRFEVNLGNINNLEEKIKHLSTMVKNIPENEEGTIDLSMWSESKPEGTYRRKK